MTLTASEPQDITEHVQAWFGKEVKLHSAVLDVDTGIVDVEISPVPPVSHITINSIVLGVETP